MANGGKQAPKEYASPESLFNIDGEHSVKTLHEQQGKDYEGTPAAAKVDVGSKDHREVVNREEDNEDDMSALYTMSRSNPIALLMEKAPITNKENGLLFAFSLS